MHVISYCQGTLGSAEPDAVGVSRNVTQCSNQTVLFAFDPADAWPEEITHGPTLEWPRVISDDFRAFRVTSQAMAVLYIIGVGATGFALIARASSFITRKTQTGLFEFGFLVVGVPPRPICYLEDNHRLNAMTARSTQSKHSLHRRDGARI